MGAAGYSITKNSLIVQEFKDNPGSVYAMLEILQELGLAIGPILGTKLSWQ